ncbi:T9SS type A sorting domain-containing protein [Saprospiraceae bacterium]|nr:T9SS type A sorting domain-containing protein [Saprospiraceae bacterium]
MKSILSLFILLLGSMQLLSQEAQFEITEIFSGQTGEDLTADWFEIRNIGTADWIANVSDSLYYDDESMDPEDAGLINNLGDISVGSFAIVLISDTISEVEIFRNVWSPVIDLTDVEIGFVEGAALGANGDAVTIWLGDPELTMIHDTASYPITLSNEGQSYDVELSAFSEVGNANNAIATILNGGTNNDVPNIASPGNGMNITPTLDLVITEVFSGQVGADLTADWFEITNNGTDTWMPNVQGDLYYDDDSADPNEATIINGIDQIAPGQSVIVVIDSDIGAPLNFEFVWAEVVDLRNVRVGITDGSSLGGGGDAAVLWIGDPLLSNPVSIGTYPDTEANDGQSYDISLGAFSVVGNTNGAVSTRQLGGEMMTVPNIGSPGNGLAVPQATSLEVTEIFPGQIGDDLTPDWFEITNRGDVPYVASEDGNLWYDDDSADANAATIINGIDQIGPNESVVILVSDDPEDVISFDSIWSEVINLDNVQIGLSDGAALGDSGDAAVIWIGNPQTVLPSFSGSYPEIDSFDGISYDIDLGEFSTVGNENDAAQTLATAGSTGDVPNIGSPGNNRIISSTKNTELTLFNLFPNPSDNRVFISGDGLENISLSIYDIQGQLVKSLQTYPGSEGIDVSNIEKGTYFIRARTDKGYQTMRFVKM